MSNPNLVRKLSADTSTGEISNNQIADISILQRNYLINGNFDYWQRGTSFNSGFTSDRWYLTGSGSFTVTRSSDTPDILSKYSLSMAVTSGLAPSMCQRIESINSKELAGKTVTLTFKAKVTDTTGANIAVWLYYPGTTDNWSSSFTFGDIFHVVDASPSAGVWKTYSTSFDLPAEVARGLEVRIVRGGVSINTTTMISQMCLTLGSQPRSFRLFTDSLIGELAACQRYYETAYHQSQQYLQWGWSHTTQVEFKVTKRATPTVTLSGFAGPNLANASAIAPTQAGFGISIGQTSGFSGGVGASGDWIADAEL